MEILGKISLAFEHGGIWMYVILAIQIVTLAIAAERVVALFIQRKANQKNIAASFERDIKKGDLEGVIEQASRIQSEQPIARVALAGAQAAFNLGGHQEIQGKMDEILTEENSRIEKRTGFLTMLANVATLMGLLGTISGMISSFAAVTMATPAEKATLLSAGISEAMNATAYGLIVAIPALLFYAVLQNRANILAEDLNHSALKIYNWLAYTYDPVGPRRGLVSQKPDARPSEVHN